MLSTIMHYLAIVAYVATGTGFIVALGMTIYAMRSDGLTGLGGLVFFVVMFLTWPTLLYEVIADEVKLWWQDHIEYEKGP